MHDPTHPADDGDDGVVTVRTLSPYITKYLRERRDRGEITSKTAECLHERLDLLNQHFGARPLNKLSEIAIERWLGSTGECRASTRRAYLSTVRGFCRWMVRRGHLRTDPTAELSRIKEPRAVPRALSAEKVARLVASRPDLRSQLIIWLMVQLGLRCCEVAGLDVEDYDPVARTLFVRGKGSHERVLPVPAIVAGALGAYVDETGRRSGPLIRSETRPSHAILASTVSQLVSAWMWDAGIKVAAGDGIAAHALRHTAASDVLDKCNDLRVVQALLGHSNIATTSRYLRRAALDQIRAAMEGRTYAALELIVMPDTPAPPEPGGSTSRPCSLREHLEAGGDLSPMLVREGDFGYVTQAIVFDIPTLNMDARAQAAAQGREFGEMYLEHPKGKQVHVTQEFWLAEMNEDEDLRQAAEALLPPELVAAERALLDAWRHPNSITVEHVTAPRGSWLCGACGAEASVDVAAVVVGQNPGSTEDPIRLCGACIRSAADAVPVT